MKAVSTSSRACSMVRFSSGPWGVSKSSISPSVKVVFWSAKAGVQAETSRGSPSSMTARRFSLTASRKVWKSTAAAGVGVGSGVGSGAGAHPASRARLRARGNSLRFIPARFLSVRPDEFPLFLPLL